jgi:hypothetical protein
LRGRFIATLVKSVQQAGKHTVIIPESGIANGPYLLELKTDAGPATRKIFLSR